MIQQYFIFIEGYFVAFLITLSAIKCRLSTRITDMLIIFTQLLFLIFLLLLLYDSLEIAVVHIVFIVNYL